MIESHSSASKSPWHDYVIRELKSCVLGRYVPSDRAEKTRTAAEKGARETRQMLPWMSFRSVKKKFKNTTELGRAGPESIWLSVRTHGPRSAWSVRPDVERHIFPSRSALPFSQ